MYNSSYSYLFIQDKIPLIEKYITFGTKITEETKVNGVKVSRRRKSVSRVKYEKTEKKLIC